jgi:hypothetical protein
MILDNVDNLSPLKEVANPVIKAAVGLMEGLI